MGNKMLRFPPSPTQMRLQRAATFAATLCARIVYLKRCARWLLTEQEHRNRRIRDELLHAHNTLRAREGLPPVLLIGYMQNGEYIEGWGSIEYRGAGGTSVALPSGMWEHQPACTCAVPLRAPGLGNRCGMCARPIHGAAPPTADQSGAVCPTPGTAPGDNGKDT